MPGLRFEFRLVLWVCSSHILFEPRPLGKWELKVTTAGKSTNLGLLEAGTLFKPWTVLLRSRSCVIISIFKLVSNVLQQSQSLTFATPNFSLSLQNNSENCYVFIFFQNFIIYTMTRSCTWNPVNPAALSAPKLCQSK